MKKILLTEDDPFLIDIYTTKLTEAGFSVKVARDGEDCLKKLKEEPFDLLLLDIVLPKLYGWEVLREIRKLPELNKLKVVILSNLSQKDEVKKGFELGVEKYFVKAHYTPSQVVEEIEKTLKYAENNNGS